MTYSSTSIAEIGTRIFWSLFFAMCLLGLIIGLLGFGSGEDPVSPYAPSEPSIVELEEQPEPNFDNLDQDGFVGGLR